MKSVFNLSQEDFESFIHEYYHSDDAVKNIIKKYGIDIQASKVAGFLPDKPVELLCPYCDIEMYEKAQSRTDFKGGYANNKVFCKKCGHKDNKKHYDERYCGCNNCKAHKEESLKRKEKEASEKLLNLIEKQKENSSSLTTYGLDTLTNLLCVLLYLHKDRGIFKAVANLRDIPLSPTSKFSNVIHELMEKGAIRMTQTRNTLEHVEFKGKDLSYEYSPNLIDFELNIKESNYMGIEEIVKKCEVIEFYEDIREEALDLWKRIVKGELYEYLIYLFEKYNFHTDYIGDALIEKLDIIIDDFSISEGMAILYTSVSSSASYKQTGISGKHAVNSINTNIANGISKRKLGEWETKGYSRNYDLPQSVLSTVFFNNIIKIGNSGFTEVPALEKIPEFYTIAKQDISLDHMLSEGLYDLIDRLKENNLIPKDKALEIVSKVSKENTENKEPCKGELWMLISYISKLKDFELVCPKSVSPNKKH